MLRILRAFAAMVVALSVALFATPTSANAATCSFVGGFKILHDALPTIVGACTGDEHHSATGDGLQGTSRGLLVWRKADNFAAFTDGFRTWINGPFGIQQRLNAQRFCWELDATANCVQPVSPSCRAGNPLANVHDPARLRVIERCAVVRGTVSSVEHEPDGDVFILLRPDPGQRSFINERNQSALGGNLVGEIVPADLPGCAVGRPPRAPFGTADFGICTGTNLAAPAVGSHISMIGPHVLDRNHGWLEIHPVWAITRA